MADDVSLRDELGSALDAAETTDATTTPSGSATDAGSTAAGVADAGVPAAQGSTGGETTAKGPADGRVRDASGRFIPKSADVGGAGKGPDQGQALAEGQQGQAQGTQPAETQPGVDLPPSTFTPAAKAAYAALPTDSPLRQDIKKREADFQKGIERYKNDAEIGNRLSSAFKPEYLDMIQREGSTPERAVASLLQTAHFMRTASPQEKGQALIRMAQQFGADLSQIRPAQAQQGEGQPPSIDPNALAPVVQQLLQPHLQEISQIKNRFQSAEQQRAAAESQAANASIESFAAAADTNGQAKHPYFADVRALMADFMERGHAADMETAYGMACRAHPEVSKVIASEQTRRQEAQRLEEAKRSATNASRANAVNATGQGGVGIAGTTGNSLRGELESLYDGSQGARL
jgi:hypothetical protein